MAPALQAADLTPVRAMVVKKISVQADEKFMVFRDGKSSFETITQIEEGDSYCAIQNTKLQSVDLESNQTLKLAIKKLKFPNERIARYTLVENPHYSLYCDFTKTPAFNERKLADHVNKQMAGWLRIKKRVL
jgi:hypothetical protein